MTNTDHEIHTIIRNALLEQELDDARTKITELRASLNQVVAHLARVMSERDELRRVVRMTRELQ